jgi:hypothetical protein
MKSEHTGESGEISLMEFVYSKVDADTMKTELYGLNENGALDNNPGMTLEFKRQKQPAPNKTTGSSNSKSDEKKSQ